MGFSHLVDAISVVFELFNIVYQTIQLPLACRTAATFLCCVIMKVFCRKGGVGAGLDVTFSLAVYVGIAGDGGDDDLILI